ncbi:hypothetical protein SAMN04489719_1198 [Agrococcus carbonis]|uniref:SpaA-like prealbumin fold domain-containing protein n=2 Tax=Agrococcus carbonis TaxID=684552 RepID=A0A1H1N874_9MICO|nr:hypothetical protein SAMN04489719_1198 [Agrococcus carbonis]
MLTRTSARRRPLGVAVAVVALAVAASVLPQMPASPVEAAALPTQGGSLYWRTVDGSGALYGGATYRVEKAQGNGSENWETAQALTVVDCTEAPCSGPDIHPGAGELQVLLNDPNHNGMRRYRVSPVPQPPGATFTSTAPAATGSSNSWLSTVTLGPFRVDRVVLPSVPCAGTAFALLSSGAVQQVSTANSPVVTLFGAWTGLTGEANGLAAGTGSELYAVDRSGSRLSAVLRYDTSGGWRRVPVSTSVAYSIVAGAYDRASSRFLFGGFTTSGSFQLHQYDAQSNAVALVGTIATGASSDGSGDMAFDGAGDLVIMRAGATSVTTFTVAAAALAAANGGSIAATAGSPREVSLSGINGAAFADDGSVLLSNATTLRRYDPVTWTQRSEITTGLGPGATDLATCAVPAANSSLTVAVQVTRRDLAADSFQVSAAGTVNLGPASTGANTAAQVGPSVVTPGQYTVTAASVPSAQAPYYSARIACTGTSFTPVDGWSASVNVPAGASVVCTITIMPLRTVITVAKGLLGPTDSVSSPGADWAMAITTAFGSGSPTSFVRTTQASGVTPELRFVHPSATTPATITVEEPARAGYAPESVRCDVIAPSGTPLPSVSGTATRNITVPGVPAGSTVHCRFLNREQPTTLTLAAAVAAPGGAAPTTWQLSSRDPQNVLGPSGATGSRTATASVTKGVPYTLTATGDPAYLGTWACVDQQGTTVPVTDSKVTVAQGSQVTCTVTLTTARLTLLKHVAGQPSALLASGFTLTATPSTAIAGLPAVTVPGSETVVPSGAGANSFDVRPDHEYRLTEATSYAALGLELQQYRGGYPANGVFLEAEWVTVTSPTARVAVGGHEVYRFVSAAPAPLALPLTGGVGADTYQLGGSGVLLLSFLASAFLLVRTRIRSRTAGRRA